MNPPAAAPIDIPRLIPRRDSPSTRPRSAGATSDAIAAMCAGRNDSVRSPTKKIANATQSVPVATTRWRKPNADANNEYACVRNGPIRSENQPPSKLPITEPAPNTPRNKPAVPLL